MIVEILLWLFALRPIIDLWWNSNIILGLNLASIVALACIGLMGIYILRKQTIRNVPIVLLMAVYTTFITIINVTSISDIDNQLRLLSSMAFILVVAPDINEKRLEKFIYIFVIFTMVPIIISFLQVVGLVPYTYWDYIEGAKIARASGGYRQPSVLTRFTVFGLLYTLYFLSRYKNKNSKLKKIFLRIYIVLNLVSLLFSYHRTGYLMSALVIFVWFIIEYKKNFIKMVNKIIIATIGLSIVFIVLYNTGMFAIDLSGFRELLSLDNVFKTTDGNFELVLRGRGNLIDQIAYSIKINPWYNSLFGNGIDVNSVTGLSFEIADMDIIRIFWNYGFVGISLWLIQIIWFAKILKYAKYYINPYIYRVGFIVLAIYIIFGFSIEATVTPNFMYHVYLVLGYIFFLFKKEKMDRDNMMI